MPDGYEWERWDDIIRFWRHRRRYKKFAWRQCQDDLLLTLPYSDPEERLNFARVLFFSTDRSLGQHTLKAQTEAFDGQVALVHGDSHYFKVDKPLNRTTGAR